MKVLLIGGTGVLSTDVAALAIERQMEVYLLNRGNRKEMISPGAHLIQANIRNYKEVCNKIKNLYFDVVVDFLSFSSEHLRSSLEIFKNKCDQYIFISSATVYSKKMSDTVITEKFHLENKGWYYASNKIKCEELLEEIYRTQGMHYTIIRPYVTYGNTRIPFAVISKAHQWTLIDRMLCEKPVVMWDDGNAICTLTHSKDFAKGVVGLFKNPKAMQEAFHITSDEHFTWNEVLQMIAEKINKTPTVVNIPSSYIESIICELQGELIYDKGTSVRFDNSKIKDAVSDFQCTIPFSDGIEKTLLFYQSHPQMMEIDYEWDAEIDRLIYLYCKKSSPEELKNFSLSAKGYHFTSFKEKINYLLYRYKYTNFIVRIFRRLCYMTRGIIKQVISRR
jgi:NAD dependent epimerase/dehydratase family.